MTQFHFIAGMPRSGSTLLAAILRQNPEIHASITSPVASLFEKLHEQMNARAPYADLLTPAKRENILRGLIENYYAGQQQSVIFDTNRQWCARMSALNLLFPKAKVIACVRDPAWVLDSFERLVQGNPLMQSKLFKPEVLTIQQRVAVLTASGGAVGFAYDATAEAFYGQFKENLIVVDYDELCAEPATVLSSIYYRLGLAPFKHEFNNIHQIYEQELFDKRFGMPGLHKIRNRVFKLERKTVLPPELFERFKGKSFWK